MGRKTQGHRTWVKDTWVERDKDTVGTCGKRHMGSVTECIVCVSGHDLLIFSLRFLFLFDWMGVFWPQLSKVLKLVRWAGSVLFHPVSLQRQVVCLLLRPVFMCSSQGRAYTVSWLVGANKKLCYSNL